MDPGYRRARLPGTGPVRIPAMGDARMPAMQARAAAISRIDPAKGAA